MKQTSEGDFIDRILGVPGSSYMQPDSTGIWHDSFAFYDIPIIFEAYGTVQSGFQIEVLGFAPGRPAGATSGIEIDHDDNIFSTQQFGDYLYLTKYNGSDLSYSKWTEVPEWELGGWPIMGLNSLSQPYFVVSYKLPDESLGSRLCMLTHNNNATSGALIASTVGSFYFEDVANSDSNALAVVGVNMLAGDSNDSYPQRIYLYYRQREERKAEN